MRIAVVGCLLFLMASFIPVRAEDGFTPLFNGKDLSGWKNYDGKKKDLWSATDGTIVCAGDGGGWLGTEKEYGDFIVKLEYRLKPGGNSGVYIRAPETGHISRVGMEIQILDDEHKSYEKVQPWQNTGAIYHVFGPKERAGKPAGEWNSMEIRADKRKVTVTVNGKTLVEADLDQALKDEKIAKEHTGLTRTTGRIGLQSHTDRVEFRNLRIKELK